VCDGVQIPMSCLRKDAPLPLSYDGTTDCENVVRQSPKS